MCVCVLVYSFALLHLCPCSQNHFGKSYPTMDGEGAQPDLDCHFWTSCVRKLLFYSSTIFSNYCWDFLVFKGEYNLNQVCKLMKKNRIKSSYPVFSFIFTTLKKKFLRKMQGHTLILAKEKPIFPPGFYWKAEFGSM